MYIRKIEIENVRGFEKLDLDFTRPGGSLAGWTVIAGRNGSGKTTLLKAIALSVAGPRQTQTLHADWIRRGARTSQARSTIVPTDADEMVGNGAKGAPFKQTYSRRLAPDSGADMEEFGSDFPFPRARGDRGWLIAAYGAFRRISGHALDDEASMASSSRRAALVTLFSEGASLAEGLQWLKTINHRALEERAGSRPKEGAIELEEGVRALLNDGLLPDEWKIDHVDSEGVWALRDGLRIPLRALGDGLRTTTSLVIDILRQAHLAQGTVDVRREGAHARALNDGVVLIDEPEAHLHVSWQQVVGFWLKEHLPNIQFIVTTHSPFVCQAADPNGLVHLAAPGDQEPSGVVSSDMYNTVVNGDVDDAVMSALFGLDQTHSPRAEALRNDVAALQAKAIRGQATEDDQAKLAQLSAKLPKTGAALVDQALRKLQASR